MKKLIACLLALFVLVGCVQQPTEEDETGETAQEAEVTPRKVAEPSSVLSDEIKDTIDEQLQPGIKSSIPVNYQKLKYGEVFVFGVGVQNILNLEDEFLVKVSFDKAYDRMMNTIGTSEEMMNDWVKTKLEPFTLAKDEKQTVAIVIEVGKIMPGIRPTPGTYVFDVEVLYSRGGRYINKEYIGKSAFSIKVEK